MKRYYCWWCQCPEMQEPKPGCYNIKHFRVYIDTLHAYLHRDLVKEEENNEEDPK